LSKFFKRVIPDKYVQVTIRRLK